jgi:hypothetical protein
MPEHSRSVGATQKRNRSVVLRTKGSSHEPAARRAGRFRFDPAKQDRGLGLELVPRHGQVADRAVPL